MDVMACFFQGWPVSAGVNFHCIQPWSTKTGRNWHYQNWCRLVEMSSRAKAFTNCPNFKDSVHKDNWHIASYCCFIQTAPTLYGTYIKNEVRKMLCWQKAVEGLLFKENLLNLRHQPFGTFALTPRCTTCTGAPSQHRIKDVMSMIETLITETSRQRNLAASILARFGKALISVNPSWERRRHYLGWKGLGNGNGVGINSSETVLVSWHHFIIWTQHLYGLQTKLWISSVACAESENL